MLTATTGFADDPGTDDDPDSTDAVEPAETDDCEPSGNFTTCYEVDLDQAVHWEQTLPDPDWRTVESDPDGYDVDYKVTLDAKALNGGVMPTAPDQGHYESIEEYEWTRAQLLGIDPASDSYIVVTEGSTAKMTPEGDPTPGTTGIFLYDALTTAYGQVYIDGDDKTDELIAEGRTHDFTPVVERPTDDTTTTVDDDNDLTTASSNPMYQVEDEAVIEYQSRAGLWEADLRISWSGKAHYASDISGVRLDGTECYLTWVENENGMMDFLVWECHENRYDLRQEVLDAQDNQSTVAGESDNETDALSILIADESAYLVGKSCAVGRFWWGKDSRLVELDNVVECDEAGQWLE